MLQRSHQLLLFLSLILCLSARATHNRAGEIIYKRIEPFTKVIGGLTVPVYTYSITIIKYTADGTGIADRCVDTVYFGDGERGIAPRINGNPGSCCANFNGQPVGCGEIIVNDPNYRVKKNVYTIIHTYPGAGTYTIRSFDPNRNADVHNIPNSINLPFYIESLLIINSFTGANSSPIFTFAPIDKACLGICFEHNPGAFDPDGDSLSYEITTSRGVNGSTVLGYFFPETGDGGTFGINATTGLVRWCTPQFLDEYNIAFIVKEWRKSITGKYQMIGYVLRDMQVIVNSCPNNQAPVILPIADVCVEAGRQVDKEITVSDMTNGDKVTIIGGGGAFSAPPPIATLNPTVGITSFSTNSSYKTFFKWQTTCDHLRSQPYATTFKAQDNGPNVKLVTFQTFNIRVVAPAIKNVTATPIGTTIRISWSPTTCNPSNNKLVGYKIYRKNNCEPFNPDPCQTGIPESSGFVFLNQVAASENSYSDNNKDNGLVVGQNYSYVVIAQYADGSQSFGGSQVCAELKRDVPVFTNVDVLSTSETGSVQVKWLHPLTSPGNLDLSVFKGPYKYVLTHKGPAATAYSQVFTSTKTVLTDLETSFTHANINTTGAAHEYLLEFYSDTTFIGSSHKATSISLTTTPSDRRIDLAWASKTPWNNYLYTVFRKGPNATTYTAIGTTTSSTFGDNQNVENGQTYCYFVRSEGKYSDDSIPKPLINNSQESCSTAKDLTPPGTTTLSIEANCPTGLLQVSWLDIRNVSDDVDRYLLFYKPTIDEPYSQMATVRSDQPLVFHYDGLSSISGCYAVQAIDVNGNIGQMSEDFCIENCPEFELPNVFSPNGDEVNDHYKAIKVRQIKEIDLTITDRWGNLVYRTNDPYFKWNGISIMSGEPVSEGTFFYVCDVFEQRLKGLSKRTLRGYLQAVR